LRLAIFGNGRGCDPSSSHWNISLHDRISDVFTTRAVCCVICASYNLKLATPIYLRDSE
jgi:hypothetical protein